MGDAFQRRGSRVTAISALVIVLGGALLLSACAAPVDPVEARESLSDVTQDPAPPEAADAYSAELHPDPVVDAGSCEPYLLITARGTGEPSSGQLVTGMTRKISKAHAGDVRVLDVDYPADSDVKEGGTIGARTLVDILNVQSEACPDQRFVLLGYSQGALVIGDSLSPPEDRMVGETVGTVDEGAMERVLAVVLFGDPRFEGAAEYNVGSFDASLDGLLPRPEDALDAVANRIRDYCVAGDFICQSSLDFDEKPHIAYYSNGMPSEGADFVLARIDALEKSANDDKISRTPPTPSVVPTPTPSDSDG
ncbi:cutinase family protein [Leucobacter japonicus]|uniref:cutinase family protein n=1 Tax=Leucobacter japonicus TaxID=1461259 RepID=UPI0006A7A12A|nr:cutinase family protein [Leucobacter japonicus]